MGESANSPWIPVPLIAGVLLGSSAAHHRYYSQEACQIPLVQPEGESFERGGPGGSGVRLCWSGLRRQGQIRAGT